MTANYAIDVLEMWVAQVLASAGMPEDHAVNGAKLLVRSDLRGYRTHGLTRLSTYIERFSSGDFNAQPKFRTKILQGGVLMNADGALGHIAMSHALELGIRALQHSVSVFIVIQNCGHLGALGVHALAAAESGLFCMIGQRTPPLMGIIGAKKPMIGNNPIAFGCPVPSSDPIIFDMACSTAARGHILLRAREHHSIPVGWAVDTDGLETTDAEQGLLGSLLPAGGHKGIGLAMLVECLAGAFAKQTEKRGIAPSLRDVSGAAGRQSAFAWLVRPDAYVRAADFKAAMNDWIETYLDNAPSDARLPGARGAELERGARRFGLPLPSGAVQELIMLGERLGVEFPSPTVE